MKTLATVSAFGAVMLFGVSVAVAQTTTPSDGSVLPFPTPHRSRLAGIARLFDRRPFRFDGKIKGVEVKLK